MPSNGPTLPQEARTPSTPTPDRLELHRGSCGLLATNFFECTCDGKALLTELLDAASKAIFIGSVTADERLDRALEPFRPLPKLEYNPNACFFLNKIRDTKPVRNRTLQTSVKGISLKKKT